MIRHDLTTGWSKGEVLFNSFCCQEKCLQQVEGSSAITHEEVNSQRTTNAKTMETQSKVVEPVACVKNKETKGLVELRPGAAPWFPSAITIHPSSDQMEDKTYNNSRNEDSRNLHKVTTPRQEMVSIAAFKRSAKGAELYNLEVSELFRMGKNEELAERVIPMEYQDM